MNKLTTEQFDFLRSIGFTNMQLWSSRNQEKFSRLLNAERLQPTYFVKHPDETYSVADPQPIKIGKP